MCLYFYPRPPRGGRPACVRADPEEAEFLSTSPAWGTTASDVIVVHKGCISIHVPRVGDDRAASRAYLRRPHFYPRPPRGGRRFRCHRCTPPGKYFYPRPPRGGRPGPASPSSAHRSIFLSTSPAWGTTSVKSILVPTSEFLSTSPAWGTTPCCGPRWPGTRISIHVPRVGDDQENAANITAVAQFLSTSPAWGTTVCKQCHELLHPDFYPRPPRGGRLMSFNLFALGWAISIHVPRVGDDPNP